MDDQTKFNWGYHDGASDAKIHRIPLVDGIRFYGTTKEWAEARGPSPYVTGYLAGHAAYKDAAWEEK